MKHGNRPIVLIRKRKHKKHEGGHGSWKIAYADFMTAMMAFFMVMWLLSIASPQQLIQIAEYFQTPLKVALTGGQRSSDSSSPIPGGGDDATKKEGEVKKVVDMDAQKRKLDEIRLNRLREKLGQLIEADPRLKALRPHLIINMVDEGLRIQIIDSQNRPMFKTGSAEVEPYMRDILRAIAPILNDIPNRISIAGHTDDIQYATGDKGYSNWELSADRANASRRELVIGGLDGGKILRIVGMADTMKLKNRGGDDAVNRRISLLVLNHDTEAAIEKENAESDAVQISDPSALEKVTAPSAPGSNAADKTSSKPATATSADAVKTANSAPSAASTSAEKAATAASSASSTSAVKTAASASSASPAVAAKTATSATSTSSVRAVTTITPAPSALPADATKTTSAPPASSAGAVNTAAPSQPR
ncbi:flagellar motor protein MotB [Pantoea stewartii]|uniref:Flagellar motor protein MotB n=1 Tax=Pantoea stewartii subsp. stewartii DC283 TaxID=660596 RepID=H3RFJ4_PANSE|nr:flagellar motor protein MotB [Pantoea stewartii]ARF50591.1 flagellar motor protein MotB [Pantoea stewartii subsp. stewartii DC283]EHU00037.1 MotB family flagellar motor rotation protein [Pantoea stewartii subsp. stewartii DC283]KAB0559286.1 flagellar motor protein MotB [Pantoea stewartii subsp. stewartii]